jgi:hypothetical protein
MSRVWAGVMGLVTVLAFSAVSASAALAAAQPTSGVEPGVTIDEGSPAAKEYSLALTQARHAGSAGAHGEASEAPFGAGITPPSSGGSGSAKGGRAAGGAAVQGTTSAKSAGAPATLPASVLRAARSSTGAGSGSSLALLGGGVAILVLGGLGGIVLRHSRRPPSHA